MFQCPLQFDAHQARRDIQALGDLRLGEVFETHRDHDFALPGGELVERASQGFERQPALDDPVRPRVLVDQIIDRVDVDTLGATMFGAPAVPRQVDRAGQDVGVGILQCTGAIRTIHPKIELVQRLVRRVRRPQATGQPLPEVVVPIDQQLP